MKKKSVIYIRTSSETNIGQEKDSEGRQRKICTTFARQNKFEVVKEFADVCSGKVTVLDRHGFKQLYQYCEEQSIRNVIFENVTRFARDVVEMEIAFRFLKEQGFTLHSASRDIGFEEDAETEFMRQMFGAFAEYERKKIALRLQSGRISKGIINKQKGILVLNGKKGKVEGRKSYRDRDPEMVLLARKLRRKNWKTGKRRSLQVIADMLHESGYCNSNGNPYGTGEISRMLKQ